MTSSIKGDRTTCQKGSPGPAGGLRALEGVQLSDRNRRIMEAAHQACGGSAVWKRRKLAETHDLLALSEIAPRFSIIELDVREAFRAEAFMDVPVPLRPNAQGDLRTTPVVLLGFIYLEEALRQSFPGTAFVQIIEPSGVWHPHVSDENPQMLCLGSHLPAGIHIKEIVRMTYTALAMQTITFDAQDPAGVMNAEACLWWQQNLELVPLSKAAFSEP